MNITLAKLKKLKPCEDGLNWYIENGLEDLLTTLLAVNKADPNWAIWTLSEARLEDK